jgi:hypothetical protein
MTQRSFTSAFAAASIALLAAPLIAQSPGAAAPTFTKDVLPILQKNCQSCHRPGEIGPMPLLSYEQARPYARAIRSATQSKKMPPWFADSSVQHYANDMSLPAEDIGTLAAWADAGAPQGDPKDAPPPRQFVDGWNIGTPDKIVEMPEPYRVPATGTIEYTYIILPTRFTEDTWIQALEIRPGNRTLMHHAVLYERTPDSRWLREYPVGVPFVPAPRPGKQQRSSDGDRTSEGSLADEWLVGYVPGAPPYTLPPNTAFLVKANSDFVLQLHYTANGTPGTDQTRIGMVLSKTPPARRAFIGLVTDGSFVIPPGDPAYQASASVTLAADVELLSAGPHMHLRGKAMDLRAVYPGGATDLLFHVPRYDFNWQQLYGFRSAKTAPRGTKLEVVGVWDNSAGNRFNPDPRAEVHWGDQSWEEMLLGLVTMSIDPKADVTKLFESPKKKSEGESAENNAR